MLFHWPETLAKVSFQFQNLNTHSTSSGETTKGSSTCHMKSKSLTLLRNLTWRPAHSFTTLMKPKENTEHGPERFPGLNPTTPSKPIQLNPSSKISFSKAPISTAPQKLNLSCFWIWELNLPILFIRTLLKTKMILNGLLKTRFKLQLPIQLISSEKSKKLPRKWRSSGDWPSRKMLETI